MEDRQSNGLLDDDCRLVRMVNQLHCVSKQRHSCSIL